MATATPKLIANGLTTPGNTDEFRLAAIDVGSNSLHMVVAEVHADGSLTELWRVKQMVGLGRLSFPSHRLSKEAMNMAIIALRRFIDEAQRRNCEKIVAVATSAVREATNGGDFIERARRELGLSIRIVAAREEARLIYLGVRHATDLANGPHLIVDIGGGSVEFVVANSSRPLLLESRKLGAARMTAQFVGSDPVDSSDIKSLLAHYDSELSLVYRMIEPLKPVSVIGTSGTLEDLATMCNPDWRSNGSHAGVIERDRFEKVLARLVESRADERGRMAGLDPHRKDQIVAGALLVNEVFRRSQTKTIRLCQAALREGIIVDYLERHVPELSIRRQIADPRRRSVLQLAYRYQWEQPHSEHVARLALEMFDQLRPLHHLGSKERELLEYAAMLHDIGWHISQKKHHKHGMYLILEGRMKGFTPTEVRVIANIARYHRKAVPQPTHWDYEQLDERSKRVVKVAAALLRVADGLDRSHCQVISAVRCRANQRELKLVLEGRGDCELELWAAKRKMRLLADVFDRTVSFEQKQG